MWITKSFLKDTRYFSDIMKIHFAKYQGTGNDFVMIDDRDGSFPSDAELIQQLCNRKYGIGSDGLILIRNHTKLDYEMVYFNSDGSQSLCGNGSRCGFAFARELGIVEDNAVFETTDGVHRIKLEKDMVHFQLFDVESITKLSETDFYVSTGSPHHMQKVTDVDTTDVCAEGSKIRYSDSYSSQNGTNVNFVQLLHSHVKMRTYERGVEDETLSCGTGATAVGLLAGDLGYKSPVTIATKGGTLHVSFKKEADRFTDIWLAGPAKKVFDGSIQV